MLYLFTAAHSFKLLCLLAFLRNAWLIKDLKERLTNVLCASEKYGKKTEERNHVSIASLTEKEKRP